MSDFIKQPEAPFLSCNKEVAKIKDFWMWSYSNLQSNLIRSILGEYIVALALGIADGVREEWNAYDLDFGEIKIEVKTSGYVQAWAQKNISKPNFSIAPAIALGDGNGIGYDPEIKRRADVYVFCLHSCKDRDKCDLLNLDQWLFYIVSTKRLNELMPNQKTISLGALQKLTNSVKFHDIKEVVNKVTQI